MIHMPECFGKRTSAINICVKALHSSSMLTGCLLLVTRKCMTDERVDLSLTGTADCPTGQAFILLQPGGHNSIIIVGAANQRWPTVLSKEMQSAIAGASLVML